MKPTHWEGSWKIYASQQRVYEAMTDFLNWPRLFPDMVRSINVLERSDTAAVLDGDFVLLGRRGCGIMKIALDPPNGYIANNTSEELGEEKETLEFKKISEGTLYHWSVYAKPKGLIDYFLGVLFGFYIRRYYERTLIRPLKEALES